MTAILALFGALFSGALISADVFSEGPYENVMRYEVQYSTLEECQMAGYGDDSICTTEKPYQRYIISDKKTDDTGKPLVYVPCDYWAGCFTQ